MVQYFPAFQIGKIPTFLAHDFDASIRLDDIADVPETGITKNGFCPFVADDCILGSLISGQHGLFTDGAPHFGKTI